MSTESARKYAESIAAQIEADCEAGYPFGIVSKDNPATAKNDGDEIDGYDYLEGVLDIQYTVSGDRQYRGGRVLIAFGGPNAWVNTITGAIECEWYSETVYVPLHEDFVNELDSTLNELWDMGI